MLAEIRDKGGDDFWEPEPIKKWEWEATNTEPGSEEKIRVLVNRIAAGLPLWHPDDRRLYHDPEEMNK